ncbi:MAG: prepilin peptidase [Chloroflexi bacterium]|nr:prepilin peptidase [Chloroflexota bacterium]
MDLVFPIFLGLAGLTIGSFLNVCIDRLPQDKSLAWPPSHCESCNRRLTTLELAPVLAYVLLGGRCRTCRARIPLRVLLVEAVTGGLFLAMALAFGPTLRALSLVFYSALFVVVFVIDLENGLVLNKVVYPAAVVAFVFSALDPSIGPLWALVGGAAAFALFLLVYIVSRGGMGGGDVKLAALVGLATGFPTVLVALFVAFVSGGVVAMALLSTGLRRRRDAVPFGPFLVVGAEVALLWGQPIAAWYARLLGVILP